MKLSVEQKELRKAAREWTHCTRHEVFESIEGYPPSPMCAGVYAAAAATAAFLAHPELREWDTFDHGTDRAYKERMARLA